MASYLLALVLIWGAKKAGRVASIVQALFWLLLAICQGFTFGSVVNHDLLGLSWSQPNEILVVLSWILIVLNFIVFCFTDYPPTYVDVKGNFLVQKLRILEKLEKWPKLTFFSGKKFRNI